MLAWLQTMAWMLVCSLTAIGVGALVLGALRAPLLTPWRCFWAGLVTAMPLAALWHLVLPLDGVAAGALLVVGAAGGARRWRELLTGTSVLIRARPAGTAAWALLWCGLPWFALQPLTCTDSGLYYVAAVEWHRTLAQVPGLQATNPLSVMNSSAFHLLALAGSGPFAGRGHVVFNAMLAWWGLPAAVAGLEALARRWRLVDFVAVLAAVPGLDVFTTDRVSCPSADVGVAWLGGALVPFALGAPHVSSLLLLLLAPMFKLSLALGCVVLALVLLLTAPVGLTPRAIARTTAVAALAWLPVLAGNVVTSGYPLYPAALGGLPLDWTLPRALVEDVSFIIRSVAAHDGVAGQAPALERFARLLLHNREVALPLLLTVAGAGLIVARAASGRGVRPVSALVLLGSATLAWAGWFALAPDPRFAGALLWTMGGLLAGLGALGRATRRELSPAARALVVLVAAGLLLGDVTSLRVPRTFTGELPPRKENVEADWVTLEDGTRIIDGLPGPSGSSRCWTVPCAAVFPRGLRRRDPADLSRGFRLPPDARLPRTGFDDAARPSR